MDAEKSVSAPSDSVIKILDGDTFILSDNRTVRIAMIDTPEESEPLYDEAANALSSMINNRRVKLKPAGTGIDRYGRMLAEVMIDTVNVGSRLLYDGLATLYLYSDNKYLKADYLPAQISAMERNTGIWALPEPVAEDFYVSVKGSFRFHRPLCPHIKNSNPDKYLRHATRREALKQGLSPCRTCKP